MTLARLGLWLADNQPGDNTGGQGPDFGKASPVALLVIILLLIAVVFLVRSMTKHLKRAHANLGEQTEDQATDHGSSGESGGTGSDATDRAAVPTDRTSGPDSSSSSGEEHSGR